MRKSFARKIILLYATFISAIIVFLLLFFNNLIYNAHLSIIKNEMEEKIRFVEQIFIEEDAFRGGRIGKAAALSAKIVNLRLTIVDERGMVISDSEATDYRQMDNHLYRPEIQTAGHGTTGYDIRRSATIKTDMLYCARRVGSFYIRLAKPLHEIDESLAALRRGVFTAGFLLFLSSIVITVIISRKIAKPIARTGEFAVKFASGDYHQRILSYSNDEIGSVQRALNIMADTIVATINDLKSDREKLRTTLETIPDCIALISHDGRIGFSNKAFCSVIGGSADPTGKLHFEVIRGREINLRIERILGTCGASHYEETVYGDREYEIFMNSVSECDGTHSVLLLFHDITEAKRIERIKSELVGNMSHELKTPIAIMRGYLETIREGLGGEHATRPYIDKAIESADRQNSLINDILKLHMMESTSNFPKEPVDLRVIIENVVTLIKPKGIEKRIDFTIDCARIPESITGSRFLAEEIFFNLIDNAVNYNNPDGSVRIAAESADGILRVHVEDTGAGIPPDALDRIFERFYRVDKSRSRATGGTGLGLSIVKHACELMSWRISVTPLHTGSRFTVEIPIV